MDELDAEAQQLIRKTAEDIHRLIEWRFGRGADEAQLLETLRDIYTQLGDALAALSPVAALRVPVGQSTRRHGRQTA